MTVLPGGPFYKRKTFFPLGGKIILGQAGSPTVQVSAKQRVLDENYFFEQETGKTFLKGTVHVCPRVWRGWVSKFRKNPSHAAAKISESR